MTAAPHDDRYDITTRSGGLRRRRITEKVFAGLAVGSAVVAVGILALVLGTVIHRGITELSLDFFTKPRPLFGQAGGIADALVGSALIVGMANQYWVRGTSIPAAQRASMTAWSRLFALPLLIAENK